LILQVLEYDVFTLRRPRPAGSGALALPYMRRLT
jgi:hypothetical protein